MPSRKISLPLQRLLLGTLTVVALTLLVACGTNAGTSATTGHGGAVTTNTSTTTVSNTGTTSGAPTGLAVQSCGTVHTMRLLIVPADKDLAKGVENCFWQAFQQCQAATMIYAQNELDTGTIHHFSLQRVNGSCVITDGVQHFIAPRPAQGTTNYVCAGLTQQADGLHFRACGQLGDVLVPSADAA